MLCSAPTAWARPLSRGNQCQHLGKNHQTPKAAAATAALFIWVNSAAGLLGAQLSGQLTLSVDPLILFAVAVGLGGFVGSKFGAEKAPQSTIRWLLIGVLVLATAKRGIDLLS